MTTANISKLFVFILILCINNVFAQDDIARSMNGKSLPAKGTLRILVIFAEIDYDVNDLINPDVSKNGTEGWKKGQLPVWKDDLLDPQISSQPKGSLTKYFKEMSFGSYNILGDYLDEVITIKQSETKDIKPFSTMNREVFKKVSAKEELVTNSGLKIDDFDLWTLTRYGKAKISPSIDDPHKIDHLMVIYRNLISVPPGNGRASPGTAGKLFGLNTDSYSVFGANNKEPFNIAKHEYAHLLLGDNNFHVGGGQSGGTNYFIPMQGGWSILGAANSALLTCNGWDRDRFDWTGPGKKETISCHDLNGNEISADLDASNASQQGRYVIRDFVTTGDVLRIKLPFLGDREFEQWLWFENHQTIKNNGSEFDKFQYQHFDCVEDAEPGLYAFMQVDKSKKEGTGIYSGYGDYLRPVPADGMHDWIIDEQKQKNDCVNSHAYEIFEKRSDLANPLTGNHIMEFPVMDINGDKKIDGREQKAIVIERVNGQVIKRLPYLGTSSTAFTASKNSEISISTNPTTASMKTLVSSGAAVKVRYDEKKGTRINNTSVVLNGIHLKIVEQRSDGSILVDVRFDDFSVNGSLRWCSDTIVLPKGQKLSVENDAVLNIDRGKTATRLNKPEFFSGELLFTSNSNFIVEENATLHLKAGSLTQLKNSSTIMVKRGGKIIVDPKAKLISYEASGIVLEEGAKLIIEKKGKVQLDKKSDLQLSLDDAIVKKRCAKLKFKN